MASEKRQQPAASVSDQWFRQFSHTCVPMFILFYFRRWCWHMNFKIRSESSSKQVSLVPSVSCFGPLAVLIAVGAGHCTQLSLGRKCLVHLLLRITSGETAIFSPTVYGSLL